MSCIETVGVIGAGAWGTALAQACARGGLSPVLQAREPEVVEAILTQRENTLFLPGVPLSEAIRPTTDFADLADCDIILAVSPAQNLRAALTQFAPYARPEQPVLICSKGIERGSLKLMTEVAAETLPTARLAVLSGPSFAAEVARGLPAAVTIACADPCLGQKLAEAISGPGVRPYIVSDLIGAEAGAAVKNVLAIACGVVEGRELGRNAHAALITRGFAEITRMCVALGGDPQTVAGLCGLGDLVLTCSSSQSRNMSVGLALGRGKTLAEALEGKLTVAEGVQSAPAVAQLATKLGIEMPICMAVDAILAGRLSVEHAIGGLLARPLKPEHEPRA